MISALNIVLHMIVTSLMNDPYQENENDDEDDDRHDGEGDGDARDLAALQGRDAAHEVTDLKAS
jgi:hypothetical protein